MPKITAKDLNRIHTEYAADPAGQEETFWSAVHNYVGRCCYSVPAEFKSDLVQDIVLEVMTHIGRFRPGTNFQKWLSAVIRNLRADSFRVNLYEVREIPFSQLGAWDDDGGYAEFEPSTLECTADDEGEESTLSSSERIITATARLNAVRANLKKPADLRLFDLLRSGLSLAQAAMRMSTTYSAVQRRFARWKEKLAGKCLIASDSEIEIVESQKRAA